MGPHGSEPLHRVRIDTYIFFFVLFGLVVFLSHLPFLSLPYYWDEAGQFIPSALDIFREGQWIPHSAVPSIHPPAVMAYLAACWKVAGFHTVVTRSALLLVAAFAVLAAFLLAIELSKEVRGAPAFLAVTLLCVSPLFFAQAMLAQLDAPAMLFTTLALLLFLQDHIALCAVVTVVLVMVKETGLVAPLVFALWLAHERRWRDMLIFAAPAVALGFWVAILFHQTGHWTGNAEFLRYNLYFQLHPVRLAVTFLRRLYFLFIANFHWVGTLAIVYAWRRTRVFPARRWQIAWWMVAAHVVMLTVLGGAALERYLLPVLPIVFAAMAASLTVLPRLPRLAFSVVLVAGLAAGNFVNPPYPFPYENNLAVTDFLSLQAETAAYLSQWYPQARISTVWPLTMELARPVLGFTSQALEVQPLPDFSLRTLNSLDWSRVQVFVLYSRDWDPPFNLVHYTSVKDFWKRFYGYVPNASMSEGRARVPFPLAADFERRGQWVDVYVNPAFLRVHPGVETVEKRAPLLRGRSAGGTHPGLGRKTL
ncbi:MAG TPA: hypothetical protein VG675_21745 [Bryobacteraceae bacterium]|nr:hypothetical protein [Bryobacteraceae bacterium]